jgi:hypothetical protein
MMGVLLAILLHRFESLAALPYFFVFHYITVGEVFVFYAVFFFFMSAGYSQTAIDCVR